MNRILFAFFILLQPFILHAEVVIEERVNSWTSPGFLWVVVLFITITVIILLSTWLNQKK